MHQFCRIGKYAYIGGGTTITQDVMPYSLTSMERNNHAYGLNKVGLAAARIFGGAGEGVDDGDAALVSGKNNTTQALEMIHEMIAQGAGEEHVKYLAEFVANSERGVIK